MDEYQDGPAVHHLRLGWHPPFVSNAYLVDDGELTLVDTGYPLNANRVQSEIERHGYEIQDIDRVLLTHYDLDHIGGLKRIADELDAPVYMGRKDLDMASGEHDPPLFHHKGAFHRGVRRVYSMPDGLEYRPVDDGETIGRFQAYHTPGHNPGHTVYVHEEGAGFLGDLVWAGDELTIPFWGDSYDMGQIDSSVRKLGDRTRFDHIYAGHGDPIESTAWDEYRELVEKRGSDQKDRRWLP